MGKLFLIRHGLSEANEAKIYGLDSPLSVAGMEDIIKIDKKSFCKPDILVTGTQVRHIQTAQLLFPDININDKTEIFNEIDFGKLEGKKITKELKNEIIDNISIIRTKYNGDIVWDRAKEAVNFISNLSYRKNKIIAVVSSAMLIQAMLGVINIQETKTLIFDEKYHLKNLQYIEFDTHDLTKFRIKNFLTKENFFR